MFYFIRPTKANLAAYEKWSGSELQSTTWLGDLVDEVVKVELKQGNMSVGEYTSKFNDLLQYWPTYQQGGNEEDLCAQYENGLRPEIQEAGCYMQIQDFNQLVPKCRIFEAKH